MPENTAKTAAILIIGNEILSGRTQDKNIQYIAERMTEIGIVMGEVRVVPDIPARISTAVRDLSDAYDYVFTTGGIGPTHDDITADNVADAFGVALEENKDAVAMLTAYYGDEGLTKSRLRMARIPVGAKLIPNQVTSAPGFIIKNVHVMAGVPRIMQDMLTHILPSLHGGAPILSTTVTCELTESVLAEKLSELQDNNADVEIGSYPYYAQGKLGVSLVARCTDAVRLEAVSVLIEDMVTSLGATPRRLDAVINTADAV
ncbi:MAG: competence/damage-inducible protein A [Alphaproteobacteria bacterium]|nr:competence/damage-inducible protein A [Alphaproteobacteria bacterium]|tara:strand:- start:291 stop:1070 length:780 start_codon:yes stop_codon:yes gene_type:complete